MWLCAHHFNLLVVGEFPFILRWQIFTNQTFAHILWPGRGRRSRMCTVRMRAVICQARRLFASNIYVQTKSFETDYQCAPTIHCIVVRNSTINRRWTKESPRRLQRTGSLRKAWVTWGLRRMIQSWDSVAMATNPCPWIFLLMILPWCDFRN